MPSRSTLVGLCCVTMVWALFLSSYSPFLVSLRFDNNLGVVDWTGYDFASLQRSAWANQALDDGIQPFLVMTTQCSGSTWFLGKIGRHPGVFTHPAEPIPYDNLESVESIMGNNQPATAAEFFATMDKAFEKMLVRRVGGELEEMDGGRREALAKEPPKPGARVVGYKIMYSQVPTDFRREFAHYVYVNNVSVVHLVRESFLEMFVSQILMKGGDKEKGYDARVTDAASALDRPSNERQYYVNANTLQSFINFEQANLDYFRALIQYFPLGISYVDVKYDLLVGPHSTAYFNAVVAFLDDGRGDLAALSADEWHALAEGHELQKLHQGSCASKISNWGEIKSLVAAMPSGYICQRQL